MAAATGDDLIERVIDSLSQCPGQVLLWGVSRAMLSLLAELQRLGLESHVLAVIDHREAQQGLSVGRWTVVSPLDNTSWDADYLVVGLDSEKEDVLRRFAAATAAQPVVFTYGTAHYNFRDPIFDELVRDAYVNSHAGGYPHMLTHLYQCLRYISARRIPGDIAEFGVYKGGTTTFIAACLKKLGSKATVLGFDTFAGFPRRASVLDMHTSPDDEFHNFEAVRAHCQLYDNIRLIIGDITDTHAQLQGHSLALSFFDTDNYSATRSALPLAAKVTVPGGIIAFDHYYSPAWPSTVGERMAAQEVLCADDWFNLHGTGIFLKVDS